MDVSPKGDPAGFVQVLDDNTLAIPDRSGNNRADTLTNILQNKQIALLFMIPGKRETLRVSGTAQIARDQWLLDQMAITGKSPRLAIVVKVETAFIHCAKCIIRSNMWGEEQREDLSGLPSLSRILIDHANLSYEEAEFQKDIDEEYQELIDERYNK